jgi:hypothetical protein
MMRLLGGLFVATLLGSFLFSRRNKDDESSEERDRRATQNTHNYYQSQNDDKSDRCQPNRSANQNRPHLYQFDDDISKENHLAPRVQKPDSWVGFEAPARSYASPSEIASNDPKVVPGHTQIKASFDQSNVNLNISTSSFPSKSVSSSSSQRPDATFAQANVKSNTTTSSLSTKTVPSSSPSRPDTISLPNNFITKPENFPSMHYVPKKDTSVNYVASKPLPATFTTPNPTSSPIYSLKQTGTSSFLGSNFESNSFKISASSKACLDQGEFKDSKSNASPKSGRGSSDIEESKKVGKGSTERYEIPEHMEEMIKNDIVPPVLKMPLSPDTYADYFAALLYAEDFYCEVLICWVQFNYQNRVISGWHSLSVSNIIIVVWCTSNSGNYQ